MKLNEVTLPALLFVAGIVTAAIVMESKRQSKTPQDSLGQPIAAAEQAEFRPTEAATPLAPNPWREAPASTPQTDEATTDTEKTPKLSLKSTEPTSELRPIEVVQIQVASIHAAVNDKSMMETCFAFASPTNRAATGPVANFTRLVFEPPYAELAFADRVQFGNEYIVGNDAEVLVTAYRAPGICSAYRFTLSKQTVPQFADCWMTDMVVQLTTVDNTGYEVPGTPTPQTNVD